MIARTGLRRAALVVAAGLLGWGIVGSAPAAADFYGALAYSQRTGAHGYSYDHRSRNAAEQRALGECANYGADCRVAIWFRNACGALAVGAGNGYGSGWGTSRSIAQSYALAGCRRHTRNCSIVRTVCTSR